MREAIRAERSRGAEELRGGEDQDTGRREVARRLDKSKDRLWCCTLSLSFWWRVAQRCYGYLSRPSTCR